MTGRLRVGSYLSQGYQSKSERNNAARVRTHFLGCCNLAHSSLRHRNDSGCIWFFWFGFMVYIHCWLFNTKFLFIRIYQIYIIWFGLVGLGWVLCHINHCWLFNTKYCFYIHEVSSISFQTFFVQAFCCRLLNIQYVIAIHLMGWLTDFYDLRFKWTATAAIGIHPTKAWLSQLVNFKNAIWTWGHFRRTICDKILF